MTLIQCPKCEHTISSVASRCPSCGTLLTQYRFVQGQGGALTECRRCSRKVLSGAMVCPYCGVTRPGRRTPYVVGILVVALAAPILLFGLLYSRPQQPAPRVLERPAATPSPTEAPAGPVPSRAVEQAPPAVATGLTPTSPAAAAPPAASDVPQPARQDTVQGAPEGAVRKWTLDWANVREGRAIGTAVVHILRPGQPVLVGDRQAGWWAVYQEGQVLGYVAGSVLGDKPPADVPPDSGGGVGG